MPEDGIKNIEDLAGKSLPHQSTSFHSTKIEVNTQVKIGDLLPKTEELERLEKISPGITNRFLAMSEANMAHRQEVEKRELDLIEIEQKNDYSLNRNGQIIFALLVISMLIVVGLGFYFNVSYAVIIGLIGLTGTIGKALFERKKSTT